MGARVLRTVLAADIVVVGERHYGSSWRNFGWHHFLSQSPEMYNHVDRYLKRCRSAACIDNVLTCSSLHASDFLNRVHQAEVTFTVIFVIPSTVYAFDYAYVVKLLRRNLRGAAVIQNFSKRLKSVTMVTCLSWKFICRNTIIPFKLISMDMC